MIIEEEPINIAYSGVKLIPHMDLVYYESPPGLQLLHCLRFVCVHICVCSVCVCVCVCMFVCV